MTCRSSDRSRTDTRAAARLAGLEPLTTYFHRLVARNAAGTTFGPVQTFTACDAVPPRRLER